MSGTSWVVSWVQDFPEEDPPEFDVPQQRAMFCAPAATADTAKAIALRGAPPADVRNIVVRGPLGATEDASVTPAAQSQHDRRESA